MIGANVILKGVRPVRTTCEEEGEGVKIRDFFANVIYEWPPVWNLKNAIVLSRAAQTDVFQLLELVEVSDSSHEGSNQGGAYFVAAISRQTCNKTSNTIYRFSLVQ